MYSVLEDVQHTHSKSNIFLRSSSELFTTTSIVLIQKNAKGHFGVMHVHHSPFEILDKVRFSVGTDLASLLSPNSQNLLASRQLLVTQLLRP